MIGFKELKKIAQKVCQLCKRLVYNNIDNSGVIKNVKKFYRCKKNLHPEGSQERSEHEFKVKVISGVSGSE